MGFYLRKAFSFGPIRFNLSKSGLGASLGVRGARIGINPAGRAYVHMGRHGVYYRKFLPVGRKMVSPGRSTPVPLTGAEPAPAEAVSTVDMARLRESSAGDLLRHLNTAFARARLAPIGWALSAITCLLLIGLGETLLGLFLFIGCAALCTFLSVWDSGRKTVVLEYHLHQKVDVAYRAVVDAINCLTGAKRIWRIETRAGTDDWKRNAGASLLVTRSRVRVGAGSPPCTKMNLRVPAIVMQDQTIFFMPDTILIYQKRRVGAVAYGALGADVEQSRFIECVGIPQDATVVDHTWRFVNRVGTPDRRFNSNAELPICLYGAVTLRSATGVNIVMIVSNLRQAEAFVAAYNAAVKRLAPLATAVRRQASVESPRDDSVQTRVSDEAELTTRCPKCGREYVLSEGMLGRKAKCACGSVFVVAPASFV